MTLADARFFVFRKHVCQYNIVQENCTTLGSMTELQNAAKPPPRDRASNRRKKATIARFPYPRDWDDCNSTNPANSAFCSLPTFKTGRKSAKTPSNSSKRHWMPQGRISSSSLAIRSQDMIPHTRKPRANVVGALPRGFPPKPLHPSLPKRQNGSKLRWNAPAHPCAPLSNSSCVRLPIAAFRGR